MSGNMERRKCRVPGCERLTQLKETRDGAPRYRATCVFHRRGTWKKWSAGWGQCPRCGWRGPLQKHRKQVGGEYAAGNVERICANCHTLQHAILPISPSV